MGGLLCIDNADLAAASESGCLSSESFQASVSGLGWAHAQPTPHTDRSPTHDPPTKPTPPTLRVQVVNAPTANTVAAAEHGIALLCALARNVAQADSAMKGGRVR